MISESDWRKFKKIKQVALERFCESILKDVTEGISDDKNPTSHGKYLYLYKLIENYDKQIALLFNDNSRSKAAIQLMMLRGENLVDENDLVKLSREILDQSNPKRYD